MFILFTLIKNVMVELGIPGFPPGMPYGFVTILILILIFFLLPPPRFPDDNL